LTDPFIAKKSATDLMEASGSFLSSKTIFVFGLNPNFLRIATGIVAKIIG